MMVQVQPEGKGRNVVYVVSVRYQLPGSLARYWPIRRLASQGDAFLYKEVDVPKLTDRQIVMLIKCYDENKVYRREPGGKHFTRVFG